MDVEQPVGSSPNSLPPQNSIARILAVVVPIALVGLAAYVWSRTLESKARQGLESSVIARMFLSEPMPEVGDATIADANNDLVADPPADPKKLITPKELVFSYVATEEAGVPDDTWKELFAAIKAKTGTPIKITHFKDAEEQLAAMRKGELHIVGLNTGLVPAAVSREGFVPVCMLGRSDGSWGYTMEFLVPAGSPIKSLADIKGHKVTFTRLDSNSGCKAPLVTLKQEANLLPERDYTWAFSLGHDDSIKGVAAKELEVAPVASDMLARMVQKKEINPDDVKSIYKSERFPQAAIGYVYNLSPDLANGIKETLLKFEWKGTGLEKEFGPDSTKFVEVHYKDDWANTRRINQVIAEARKAGMPAKTAKSGM
jgi:phosphonate transport system substrate-binding protein